MQTDFSDWTPRDKPAQRTLEGRYVRLEPLDASKHGDDLFAASATPDSDERFRWLGDEAPQSRVEFQPWLEKAQASTDPLFFTVIDQRSNRIAGRQTFMRIDTANGVVEIGNILWNPPVAQKPAATEALYLFARHVFDDLGYRRFEWKCNAENMPSRRAAMRFGFEFEGIFRNHMIIKGKNRDTTWFSMTDQEWPLNKAAFEAWLSPDNFNMDGSQKRKLDDIRSALSAEQAKTA